MEEKAKLTKILAEAEFLKKTQLAENQAERLKIQEKLAKAKARSEVYAAMQDDAFVKKEVPTNEEFKREHTGPNTKITVGVHQQILKQQKGQLSKGATDESNALKSKTIKSSLESCDRTNYTADAQAKSATLPKDTDGEMSRMLYSLLQQQSAPDVDIQTFAGDPLEYHFFMSSFTEAVERKVDDPHHLLQLLKLTDGAAKETIRHCIQQPSEIV